MASSLPIILVNIICEWAADSEQEWIPFFCSKTGELSYKVNKHCKNLIKKGDTILHNISDSRSIEGIVVQINMRLGNILTINYRGILFEYKQDEFKMYIEFDSEVNETKKGKHIYRAMINFITDIEGGTMNRRYITDLYLNGAIYGIVYDAHYEFNRNEISLFVENY